MSNTPSQPSGAPFQSDGYAPFGKYKTYYKVFGGRGAAGGKPPLLVLHGGPGGCHNYLLPLARLGKDRQVIFYDQTGCGLSSRPSGKKVWNLKLFLEEIEAVRAHLQLPTIHLLGHSWGGMLAIEYMLSGAGAKGVQGLVLASSMVSVPLFQQEVDLLKQDLPGNLYEIMRMHEEAGTTMTTEYQKAHTYYDRRHIFRGEVYPPEYATPPGGYGTESYHTLWGPSEAFASGSLKNWDRIGDLRRITNPTLITSGQYDELTPAQAVVTHDAMPDSRLHILSAASHLAHIERAEDYAAVVAGFLREADKADG